MKEEVLEKIKKDYEDQKNKKEKYQQIKKRIKELERNELVKEYLQLLSQTEFHDYQNLVDLPKDKIIERSFRKHITSIQETNEIYVYLGTFIRSMECDIEHGPNDDRVKRDDPKAEYRLYQNIENYDSIEIPIHASEEFERTHKIIIPQTYCTSSVYYDIQKDFIKTAIEKGQETACKKILRKKYK